MKTLHYQIVSSAGGPAGMRDTLETAMADARKGHAWAWVWADDSRPWKVEGMYYDRGTDQWSVEEYHQAETFPSKDEARKFLGLR